MAEVPLDLSKYVIGAGTSDYMRTNLALLLAAVLATAPAACSNGGTDSPEPTYEVIVERVLKPSCTFMSCHANPTVAAQLDLTEEKACRQLINRPSCLFPERMRIVPHNPDESFFFLKLADEGLDAKPTGTCAESNFLMPFGAAALPENDLELVREWIVLGAECKGPPPPPPVEITSVSANNNAPVAGVPFTITVTLSKGAPTEGQRLRIEPDDTKGSLSAPSELTVPAEAVSMQFEVSANRPTSRFKLKVSTGDPQKGGSSMEIILRIAGLDIAEVLADPSGVVDEYQWIKLRNRTTVPIDLSHYSLGAGTSNYAPIPLTLISDTNVSTLAPGKCALIGGPQSAGTGNPPYWKKHDFEPDLPNVPGPGGIAGFALFDELTGVNGTKAPVDAMLVGSNKSHRLLGPDATVPEPYCVTPATGFSALRSPTGAPTCVTSTPEPDHCPE